MSQKEDQDIARRSLTNLPEVKNISVAMIAVRDSVQTFIEKQKQEELQAQKRKVLEIVQSVMTRVRSGNYHDEFSFDKDITPEELEDLMSKIEDHILSEASLAESQRLEFINRIIANANGLSMAQLFQLIHVINANIDDISAIINISEAEISKIFDSFFGLTDEEKYEYDNNYEDELDGSWQVDELYEDEDRKNEIGTEIEERQIAHDVRVKEMDELKDLTEVLQQQRDELVQEAEVFANKIDEQIQEVIELEKNTPELPDNLLQIIKESDVEDVSLEDSLQRVEEYGQMIEEFTAEQKEQINIELDKEIVSGGDPKELMLNLDALERWNENLNEEIGILREKVAVKSEESDALIREVELDENTNEVIERLGLGNIEDDGAEVVTDDVKTGGDDELIDPGEEIFVAPQSESYDPFKEDLVQEKGSMMSSLLNKLKSKVVDSESGVVGEINFLDDQKSWEVKEVFPVLSNEEVKKKEISVLEGLDSLKAKIADLQRESELPDINNVDESKDHEEGYLEVGEIEEDYLEVNDDVMDFVHDEDENNIEFDESVISSSTQSLKDRFNKYKESHGEAVKEVEPEAQEVAQEEKEEENVSVNSVIQSLRDRLNAIKAKDAGSSDKENLTGVPSTSVEKPFIDVVVSQQVR